MHRFYSRKQSVLNSRRLGLAIIWLALFMLLVVLTAAQPESQAQAANQVAGHEGGHDSPSMAAVLALIGMLITGGGIIWKGGGLESLVRTSIQSSKETTSEFQAFKKQVEEWNANSRADRATLRADIDSLRKSVDGLDDDITEIRRDLKR